MISKSNIQLNNFLYAYILIIINHVGVNKRYSDTNDQSCRYGIDNQKSI